MIYLKQCDSFFISAPWFITPVLVEKLSYLIHNDELKAVRRCMSMMDFHVGIFYI